MSENLCNFLVDLTCNPDLMARFLGDPATVLAHAPLTDQERSVVMTRNSRLLAEALGATGYSLGVGVGVITPSRKAPGKKKGPVKKTPKKPAKKAPARKKAPAKTSTPRKKQ